MALRSGDIYYADYEDMEPHKVIVVSRELFNRGKYVTVVVCTSQRLRERAVLPNCVFFRAGEFGFTQDCVAQGETLSFIEINQLRLADGLVATLDGVAMRSLIRAIGYVIESECEPE